MFPRNLQQRQLHGTVSAIYHNGQKMLKVCFLMFFETLVIVICWCVKLFTYAQGRRLFSGIVEPSKGGLGCKQRLKNKDKCSLLQNTSRN